MSLAINRLFRPILLIALLKLQACAVIHFENGEPVPDPKQVEIFSLEYLSFGIFGAEQFEQYGDSQSERHRRWYHHALFQLAELSNPLEITKVCRGLDWNQVTTEVTPFDAFVGLIDNALLFNASSAGLDLWSPWSIEYSCRPL